MVTAEAYEDLARRWERIRLDVLEASRETDLLGLDPPVTIADLLLYPAQLRAAGAAQGGPGWFTPDQKTDDA